MSHFTLDSEDKDAKHQLLSLLDQIGRSCHTNRPWSYEVTKDKGATAISITLGPTPVDAATEEKAKDNSPGAESADPPVVPADASTDVDVPKPEEAGPPKPPKKRRSRNRS